MPYLRKPLEAFLLCGIVSCFQNSALAQITPDNTLGSEASRVTTNVLINGGLADRIDGGAIRDINLFHSFSEFNINEGQRVYFANPSGVQNILTRVTGGNGSNIFGTLGVDGNANLFLVNPNGMLFGENARLDLRGSFVGTTANGLQFGNQGFFNATNPQEVPLLTVNPSALFYNQINPDAGIVNNSIAPAGTNPAGFEVFGLRVPDGKSLLLVGGNVNLDSGQLNAYGGRVELGGLSAPGSINLLFEGDNLKLGFPDNVARADVSLTNNANVLLTEGSVTVNARNLNILGSVIVSRGSLEAVNSKAGNIEINATDITTIDGTASITNSSAIFSGLADGSGSAGDITINTGSLAVTNGVIGSLTNGEGNAGDVNITAKGKFSLTTGGITSIVASSDGVNGANVNIKAREISLADSAIITNSTGKGSSGNIQIKADDSVFVTGSSTISSETFGKGNAGNIDIEAGNLVSFDGVGSNDRIRQVSTRVNPLIVSTPEFTGERIGGDINIKTGSLLMSNAKLETSTYGKGNAGNVQVTATDAISLASNANILSTVEAGGGGKGGNINISGTTLSLTDGSQLLTITRGASDTQTAGKGDAGNINVKVSGTVDISGKRNTFPSGFRSNVGTGTEGNGGNITVDAGSFNLGEGGQLSASTYGKGNAGNIQIRAKDVVSLTDAEILSTVEAGGDGEGGNIDINATTLILRDSAQLLTITRGASDTLPAGKGDAGDVNIKVTGLVDIVGEKNRFSSGIFSYVDTGTEGNGGNITIDSGSFLLRDSAQLRASADGKGNAGNVQVTATDAISLAGNAYILSTVEAGGDGEGGNINISGTTLSLTDGAQLLTLIRGASDTQPGGRGDAGNVNVKFTGLVDIVGEKNGFSSGIFSYVDTGTEGNGGNITIDSGSFLLRDSAQLQASTYGKGNAGNVQVTATDAISLAGNAYILSTVEVGGEGLGGNIDINAATLSLTDGAQLLTLIRGVSETDTQLGGRGDAGNVNVKVAGLVDIAGKKNDSYSGIFSVADTGTVGNAGNITIDSSSLLLRDGALINARTKTDGQGGNITVNTDIFEALNGGQLIAITSGNGNAGNITINASEKTTISGSDPNNNRLIQFPDYVVLVGVNSGLFVNSSGSGDTGDIEVNSPKITLDNQGQLNANSASGNGGNINLTSNLLLLRRGGKISTNAGTAQQGGDGGNINLDSTFIVAIPKENSDITANAFTGKGGNIDIKTQGIFGIEPRSQASDLTNDITASSELGVQGDISITEPDVDPAQGTIELPTGLEDQSDQIGAACPRNFAEAEKIGSFTVTGRGSLPPSVLEPLAGSNDIPNLVTLPNDGTTQTQTSAPANQQSSYQQNQPFQEAQGWVKHPNGKIELVATNSLSGFTGTQNRVVCPK